MRLRILVATAGVFIAAAVWLVGCADAPPSPLNVGLASTGSPGPVDGTYVGPMRILPNSNPACFAPSTATIQVTGGKLEYRHFRVNAVVDGTVSHDGAFSGSGYNQVSKTHQKLAGKIAGNQIEADTDNSLCFYHLESAEFSPTPCRLVTSARTRPATVR
jgi:hypothetical protein